MFFDGVTGKEAPERGRVVAVVVVNKVEFGIVELRRPLEWLSNAIVRFGNCTERSVGICCADVAGGTEELANVFRNVVAVGEPGAVFLYRKSRSGKIPV